MAGVEVAPARDEEVGGADHADDDGRHPFAPDPGERFRMLRLPLGKIGPQEQEGRCGNQDEGQEGIGPEEGDAVLHQGFHQHILHAGVGGAFEIAEEPGGQPAQQREAAREAKSPPESLQEAFFVVLSPHDAVQGHKAQHRQAQLQHHQRHGHRAELVIQRQNFETEGGKSHEMAAYGHEDSQDCRRQEPPFLAPPVQAQAQHKEKQRDGAHVHGSGGKRLRAPVHRQLFGHLLEVLLPRLAQQLDGGRFLRIHRSGRCPAVEVGNHQVGKLFPAVAPRSGIVQIQALCIGAILGQFGAAPHGLRRVFGQRKQLVHIGGDAGAAQHQQQERCHEKRLPGLCPDGMNQLHQRIQQHHNGQIVGNLLVVGLDLHAQRQAEKGGTEKGFPGLRAGFRTTRTIGINQRRQHPGHEGDGLHLGIVPHLDNLEIVAAEGDGHGAAQGNRPIHPQCQEQQEGPQQRNEQVGGRPLSGEEPVVNPLGVIPLVLRGNGRGGHSAEHGIRPVGGVVRVGLVPLGHLMRHAHIAGNVALVHDFTVQNLRHKTVTQRQEQGDGAQADGDIFHDTFHAVILLGAAIVPKTGTLTAF